MSEPHTRLEPDNVRCRYPDMNIDGLGKHGAHYSCLSIGLVERIIKDRRRFQTRAVGCSRINYILPGTVLSLRDGWQWTCSSGAIVSGLLAGTAGQMIGLVRTSPALLESSQGLQSFALTMCYAALILNISSTIGSFVVIDNLGEMGFRASCMADELDEYNQMGLATFLTNKDDLLIKFGASTAWKWMVYHWLCTFYLGIVSLIVAVLTYILAQEGFVPKVTTSVLVGLTVLPSTYFIFVRPFIFDR